MSEKSPTPEELMLIKRSQFGGLDAFGELVRIHQGWLRGQLTDWTVADDLAQETFVTALKKIKQYRGDGRFESWLRSIAHNYLRNYIRKHREVNVGGADELQCLIVSDEDESFYSGSASLEALRHCLAKVKNPAKQLLKDRYQNGVSVPEMASKEGVGYSTMTVKLHRLRKSLATCIENKLTSSNK